jgi:hypothetical protein
MDFTRLRTGELIAGASGVLLLIVMFLAWYGVSGSAGPFGGQLEVTANAWEAYTWVDLLMFVTAIAAIGAAVLAASDRSVALPVAASVIVTILGILAAILVLYRHINEPGPNELIEIKFGAYLGLLACLGIAAGGFMAMADEGTSLSQAAQQVQGAAMPAPPAVPRRAGRRRPALRARGRRARARPRPAGSRRPAAPLRRASRPRRRPRAGPSRAARSRRRVPAVRRRASERPHGAAWARA